MKIFFNRFGNVIDVKILTNDDEKPQGTCFVTFGNEKSCQQALKANCENLNGRNIKVELSSSRGRNGSGRRGRGIHGEKRGDRGRDRGRRNYD